MTRSRALALLSVCLLTAGYGATSLAQSTQVQKVSKERAWPFTAPPAGCPFPQSTEITGVIFTGLHAEYDDNGKRGADTWYPSWADDDRMVSPWTDGYARTNDGSNKRLQSYSGTDLFFPKVTTTGYAVIEGSDPLKLKITRIGLLRHEPYPYGGQYPCGSLACNGVWYYGSYALDSRKNTWDTMGPFVGFDISKDFGKTWEQTRTAKDPLFGETGKTGAPVKLWHRQAEYDASPYAKGVPGTKVKIGAPHFVDFGKNMQHSPDGKAYLVAQGDTRPNPQTAYAACDQAYLLRVKPSPATMNNPRAYEFFAGHGKDGKPIWTSDFKEIQPLLEWNNHMGCVTITYDSPLKKYLMWITDSRGPNNDCCGAFDSFLLESSAMTGPWKMVVYLKHFGDQAYFINVPSRFIGSDGRTLWMCHSGQWEAKAKCNLAGCSYALCLRQIRLVTK